MASPRLRLFPKKVVASGAMGAEPDEEINMRCQQQQQQQQLRIGTDTGLLLSRECFKPRHNLLSNVRTNVRKYAVTWLEHSRESNMPEPGPLIAELSIKIIPH